MSRTLQTFLQNEVRALEITVRDQDGNAYAPDAAYFQVQDEDGLEVVAEQAASVVNNTVNALIGTTTTAQVGTYYIIWRLVKGQYTYYHVTELEVHKLI
jgi:hypothetical protein